MKKFKLFEISLLVGFLIAVAFSITSFAGTCEEVRGDVLRLHVLANSDSEEDQQLKLKVRDALLKSGKNIFDGSLTRENAEEKIKEEKEILIETAEKVIEENGFDYDVEITVTEEFFTTRTYENVTLPAGKYMALRVLIGESAGKNWWCVMFPPLCIPAVQPDINLFFTEDEIKLVESDPKYEPRFKIVEIYESLKNRFDNN
ncbi:MAG: stage II sporulation protein R [Ruminococcaceae bacterium]|nr:stage II sporulation protein R [Oscillospiraceae bacterium]